LLDTRCGTNGRNLVQQVLKVALLFPVLERGILLSSLEGVWDRVRKGLAPLSAGKGRPDEGFFRTASYFIRRRLVNGFFAYSTPFSSCFNAFLFYWFVSFSVSSASSFLSSLWLWLCFSEKSQRVV
jgi:hypothetical protein